MPEGETARREGPVGRARLDGWFREEANAHSATMHWKHEVTQTPNCVSGTKPFSSRPIEVALGLTALFNEVHCVQDFGQQPNVSPRTSIGEDHR